MLLSATTGLPPEGGSNTGGGTSTCRVLGRIGIGGSVAVEPSSGLESELAGGLLNGDTSSEINIGDRGADGISDA